MVNLNQPAGLRKISQTSDLPGFWKKKKVKVSSSSLAENVLLLPDHRGDWDDRMATQTHINTGYNKGMHPLSASLTLWNADCVAALLWSVKLHGRACLSQFGSMGGMSLRAGARGLVPLPCPLLNTLLTDGRRARRSVFSSSRKHEGTEDKPLLFIAPLV